MTGRMPRIVFATILTLLGPAGVASAQRGGFHGGGGGVGFHPGGMGMGMGMGFAGVPSFSAPHFNPMPMPMPMPHMNMNMPTGGFNPGMRGNFNNFNPGMHGGVTNFNPGIRANSSSGRNDPYGLNGSAFRQSSGLSRGAAGVGSGAGNQAQLGGNAVSGRTQAGRNDPYGLNGNAFRQPSTLNRNNPANTGSAPANAAQAGGNAVNNRSTPAPNSNTAISNGPTTVLNGNTGVANRANFGTNFGPNFGHGPYSGFHNHWVNGYWNGHYGYWNGFANGFYSGALLGWGFGPAIYGWGYVPYYNPYYFATPVTVGQPLGAFNYAAPINTAAAPPVTAVAEAAVGTLDTAREAFRDGNYERALKLIDEAIAKMPNDPVLHEFRALVLFALKDYDRCAAVLYAALSVGPGWDWTTLVSCYPNVETYTDQLRALEASCKAHPESAAPHFVLADQYISQGHTDAALKELKTVVKLQPNDALSAALIRQLSPPETVAGADAVAKPAAGQAAAATVADAAPQVKEGKLTGTWKAEPAKWTTITLLVQENGRFTWTVNSNGSSHKKEGASTYSNGELTLVDADNQPLVGNVLWQPDGGFRFKLVGGPPDDPGLVFHKV